MSRRVASVRARTTIAASGVVAVALVVGALLIVVVLRCSLVSNVDSAARTRANDVAALIRQGNLPTRLAVPGEEDALVQVVDIAGRVVASSANLEGQGPIVAGAPAVARPARTLRNLPIGDGHDFRIVALRVDGSSGARIVYVAANLAQVDESVNAVRDILFLGLPMLLLVVGATSWVIVGRALRPVDAIRAQVADITSHDLARRVQEPPVDDEIGRLARTMNAMLDRLQTAAERQRRFVADASHELRSPIASTRAELEVATAHPEATDWMGAAGELLEDNERMERLVADLLFLARAEDPSAVASHTAVDLDDVVRAEVNRATRRAGVTIDARHIVPVEVTGSAEQLGRVVRNLLENAARHAVALVVVEVRATAGYAEVVVSDDGPGVPSHLRERVFERFARLDGSRSRGTGGAGLGLAITREVAEAHGGRIFVADSDAGARFVLRLPTR